MFADYKRITVSASLFALLDLMVRLFDDLRYFFFFRYTAGVVVFIKPAEVGG